jgi:hypothetical protein
MATFLQRARPVTDLGMALTALGLAGLLPQLPSRVPAHAGDIDRRWLLDRARAVELARTGSVLGGSTVALLAGAPVALLDGSWIRSCSH